MNHMRICVEDVGRSREFYEKCFGFKKKYQHGHGVFLENDRGFSLAIDPLDKSKNEKAELPEWFHIGICLDNAINVAELYNRLKQQKVRFAKDLMDYDGEATAFYCLDPDGYRIQVSWHRGDA